ncbi:MAG: hypothetical protein HN855_13335 [Anaerolineae bacterium]|jgi:hypothetical protein|nr:hypothetical protein [Anaerolineae bacterium]MBT7071463.1 hypothetical protein [Anaerolineae bacterium]MBT7326137.1 hypothetical protein [Anaerolineae bacterium]
MNKKNISLLSAVIILTIGACSLPSSNLSEQAITNTAIAQTVQAVSGGRDNTVATPRPSKTPQSGVQPASGSQSNIPTPTTIPPKPAPAAGANSAPVSGNLQVDYVNYLPSNTVYYGNCSGGEDTLVHVESALSPLDDVKEVLLWFDISDPTGIVYTGSVSMWQLGIGDYAGDIDIGQIAPNAMNGNDGSVTFWVEVVDKNSASIHSNNAYSLSIWVCGGGVLGPPPTGEADIVSFFGPARVTAGDIVLIEWDVFNACKVFLDGNEVNHADTLGYSVPSNEGNTTYTHSLVAWGASCDNTTEKTSQVSIQVSAAGGNNNGGGNNGGNAGNGGDTVVRFHNNSSHHIVELQIDGQEVILTEAQTILANGGYLDITVPAGSHNYAAGAGFWSGGLKNSIYPMPGGSFSDQSRSVTINDPSITQIMTQYGNSGYFGGFYWDNTTPYCAAFNFYSDGSFDFYIDGTWNDSGTYSLVQRQPGSYGVVFNVSSGSEQFNGTYYYSGAAAGFMYMNNGPAGSEQIDYVFNGGC